MSSPRKRGSRAILKETMFYFQYLMARKSPCKKLAMTNLFDILQIDAKFYFQIIKKLSIAFICLEAPYQAFVNA